MVSVPEETRFFEQVVLTEGREHGIRVQPEVRKQFVELSEPEGDDLRRDLDRLRDALGEEGREVRIDLSIARRLPELLREADFRITVVRDGDEVISLAPGDTTGGVCGVAVDIGNAALVGARLALMCSDCRREARRISETTEYIELANRPDFQMFYAEAMMFPAGQ